MKSPPRRPAPVGSRTAIVAAIAIPAIVLGACAVDRFPKDDDSGQSPTSTTGPGGPGGGGVGGMTATDENTDALCSDGIDNDGDGCADCRDFGCKPGGVPLPVCQPPDPLEEDENTDELCSDGIDNDGNGYADCRDFSCSMNAAITVCENTDAACSDGVDNDCNGFIDCEDFGCSMNPNVTICN